MKISQTGERFTIEANKYEINTLKDATYFAMLEHFRSAKEYEKNNDDNMQAYCNDQAELMVYLQKLIGNAIDDDIYKPESVTEAFNTLSDLDKIKFREV